MNTCVYMCVCVWVCVHVYGCVLIIVNYRMKFKRFSLVYNWILIWREAETKNMLVSLRLNFLPLNFSMMYFLYCTSLLYTDIYLHLYAFPILLQETLVEQKVKDAHNRIGTEVSINEIKIMLGCSLAMLLSGFQKYCWYFLSLGGIIENYYWISETWNG